MSKATLVSLYPLEFDEKIPFIYPQKYIIPASDGKTPQVLVISDGFNVVDNWVGDDNVPLRIPIPAEELANSVINDFRNSCLGVDEVSYPAVFAISGEYTAEEVLKTQTAKINEMLKAQRNWLQKLVRMADDDWQRFRQHKMINDLQRLAVRALNLEREYMFIETTPDMIECPGCGEVVDKAKAICKHCRCVINKAAYEKLTFAGA